MLPKELKTYLEITLFQFMLSLNLSRCKVRKMDKACNPLLTIVWRGVPSNPFFFVCIS